jgi:hypothetical protein
VDAVMRELDVVVIPGFSRPMVRSEDLRAALERWRYRDGERVRSC